METRAEIAKRLSQAVNQICKGPGDFNAIEDILTDFVDVADFMDYFKATWYPKLGLWIKALKTFPLASQEASAAMEFYHNQLRLRLMNEKDPVVYQRADWLADKLGTKVHSYFWLDEYSGKDDFARYWKDEWLSGLTAWRKSLKIPDAAVFLEGNCAKVINLENRDTIHVVLNPGSEFALCNCDWAKGGNLCEHVIKTIKLCRDKESSVQSVSMFQYNQALLTMLQCPPNDSLIRDHAISLAVWVQQLLDEQIGQGSSGVLEQSVELSAEIQDGDIASRNNCSNGNILSNMECGHSFQLEHFGLGADTTAAMKKNELGENGSCSEVGSGQPSAQTQASLPTISTSFPLSVNGHDATDGSSRVYNDPRENTVGYPAPANVGPRSGGNCPEANDLRSNDLESVMDVDSPGLSSSN